MNHQLERAQVQLRNAANLSRDSRCAPSKHDPLSTRFRVIALLLFILVTLVPFVQCVDHPDDIAGLTALFNSTGGSMWTNNTGWTDWIGQPQVYSICSAFGVTCSLIGQQSRVTALSLAQNQLQGTIPSLLSAVSELKDLDLNSNQLTSSIPQSLGKLVALQRLDFSTNQLSGTIPSSVGNLTALEYLDLDTNQLSGTIPPSLGNLRALQKLYLYTNQLTGTIPSSIGNLSALQRLYVFSNALSGMIPSSLGSLSALNRLSLQKNQLSGTIPDTLSSLLVLQRVDVSRNQLSGTIPASLGNLTALDQLDFSTNQLTGTIPSSFGNLSALQFLDVDTNQLTGTIPPSLGNLSVLRRLYLYSNQLTGTIPPTLGQLSSLQRLDFSVNKLSGSIPSAFGDLTSLEQIDLDTNLLTGTMPSSLGNLSALQRLYLYTNQLTGSIPASFGNCTALLKLDLHSNLLTGTIPASLGNLVALEYIDLNANLLSGSIPASIGRLSALQQLYLSKNQLSGTIPPSLGNLSALKSLDLSTNQLSGTLPSALGNLVALQKLALGQNYLSGAELPIWLRRLSALVVLDFGSNQFSGNFDVLTAEFFPAFVNVSNNLLGPSFSSFRSSVQSSSSKFSLVDVRSFDESSGFVCPYPDDYPQTVVTLRSPCRPSWSDFGEFSGYGAASIVAALGLHFILRQLVSESWLELFVFAGHWLAALASLLLDVLSLWSMMNTLLVRTDHCTPINNYAIFSQFTAVSWNDMPASSPNTTFAVWIQEFIDFPPAVLPTDHTVIANLQSFRNLCTKIPECGVDSVGTSCAIVRPELASSGRAAFAVFFACLIAVILLRGVVELSRMLLVVWSMWNRRIVFGDSGAVFIGRSVFAPLLCLCSETRREFDILLVRRNDPFTHQQLVLELVYSVLLTSIPLLSATWFYITVVAQTGVTGSTLVSIVFTGFSAFVLIGRALFVWITSLVFASHSRPLAHASADDGSSAEREQTRDLGSVELLGGCTVKSDEGIAIELSSSDKPQLQ